MEVDFDKEIDAILRNARRDSPTIPASRHLDADEISAFAENAMPEKSRSLYAAHMADCDRCRKILSGVLVLSSEAVPMAAKSPSVITIAERSVPWYRSLFLFPNLAYVMGGLVLIFGGFLAFSVFQNSRESLTAGVADQPATMAPETAGEGGPRFETNELESLESNSAGTAANVAANTMPMSAANANASANTSKSPGGPRENNFVMDGVSTADTTSAPVGAAAPASSPTIAAAEPLSPAMRSPRDDVSTKSKLEEKEATALRDSSKKDVGLAKQQAGVPVQSGPMNNERQYNRQLENMDAQAKRAQTRGADADSSSGRKVVSGRTFERKQGVWYDTSYQGHPTINVRRGSDEFKRLDAGLRNVANSLSGTIVVVWGAKAYRIQ